MRFSHSVESRSVRSESPFSIFPPRRRESAGIFLSPSISVCADATDVNTDRMAISIVLLALIIVFTTIGMAAKIEKRIETTKII
jgi:hypothetical protein